MSKKEKSNKIDLSYEDAAKIVQAEIADGNPLFTGATITYVDDETGEKRQIA